MRPSLTRAAAIAGGVLSLAACADQPPVSPAVTTVSERASLASAERYLVLANGNGFAKDFASRVAALGGTIERVHGGAGFAVVSGLTADAATQLARTPGIGEVAPDAEFNIDSPLAMAEADASDVGEPSASSVATPNTASRYVWQWNMTLIGANKAWAAGKLGDPGVTVAILDTGLDYNITDLNGLVDLSRSASFIPADDALATQYFPSRNKITDFNGHGTNVANQISSKAAAIAGVTSKTTLIGVKVLNRSGSGSFSSVMNGVLWAADHGADVANMSLGGGFAKAASGQFVSFINRVFNYANRQGMLIVVSAGNESEDLDHNGNELKTYCDQPHVVCVSSVGPATGLADQDAPSYYTNFGRSAITVAAPGGNANEAGNFPLSARPWGNDIASWVWSYCPKDRIAGLTAAGAPVLTACTAGNRLSGFIGTSQASPHVSGLAALLVAEYGHGQPSQIKQKIIASAVDLGEPGTDPYYGRGRIDVAKALGL